MNTITSRITIWLAWIVVSILYGYQSILKIFPNIAMTEIMQRFAINADIFGQFVGIYYVTYAGFHLPLGNLLDRKGPKITIPLCMIISILGFLPLLYSNSWVIALIGRSLTGFGSSVAILGLFKVVHLGFSEEKFSRMLGIGVTIGLFGAIYGSQPISAMIIKYGYATVLKYLIFVGILLSICAFIVMPKAKGIKTDSIDFKRDFSALWKKKKVFLIGIFGGLMVGPVEGFADAWGTTFLEKIYNVNTELAAFLPSLIFAGMCVGTTLMSYIADKTRYYYGIIIFSAFCMSICFILILFAKINISYLHILLFVVGLFSAYQVLTVYKATTYVKENLVGISTASVNMIIMSFGYLFHTLIGKIIQATWDGKIVGESPIYSPHSFTYGISVIPIALVLGGIGFIWIRKKS